MGRNRILDEVEEYKILKLYNKGYTAEAIGKHLGMTACRIQSIVNRFRDSGLYVRGKVYAKKRYELEPLAVPVKDEDFVPHEAIFANVVDNIKTPEVIIEGERYIDVTQIILNANEIEAMGKKFVGVRKNGKKKTL